MMPLTLLELFIKTNLCLIMVIFLLVVFTLQSYITLLKAVLVWLKIKISDKIELMRRFGHNGDEHKILGINAKQSEFNAAMGLANFKY